MTNAHILCYDQGRMKRAWIKQGGRRITSAQKIAMLSGYKLSDEARDGRHALFTDGCTSQLDFVKSNRIQHAKDQKGGEKDHRGQYKNKDATASVFDDNFVN